MKCPKANPNVTKLCKCDTQADEMITEKGQICVCPKCKFVCKFCIDIDDWDWWRKRY